MRKTLFVLSILLLFVLAGCGGKEPLSDDSNSAKSIFTASPAENETVSDPTESTMGTKENHDTQPSLPQTNDATESRDIQTPTAKENTVQPPAVSEKQKDTSRTDVSAEPKPDATPTEPIPPPAAESSVPETEPVETETVPPSVKRPGGNEVASLIAMYVNQYRGAPAILLPGLGGVANYRAQELVTNFAHTDGIDACNALQYGEFVDMTLYGMSESDSYYQGYNREAIARGNWGGTADEIARQIATGFKNSTSHWNYLGASEYSYMAVGCVYDEATSMWYCCICVSSKNYGG